MHAGLGDDAPLTSASSHEARVPGGQSDEVPQQAPRVLIDLTDSGLGVDVSDSGTDLEDGTDEVAEVIALEPGGLLSAGTLGRASKRLVDIVGSGLMLLVLSPLLLVIAVAIRLSSPGPAVYVQSRVGKDGEPFSFYKFRSMIDGAHQLKEGLLAGNEASGPVFKMKDDPRITPLGYWLRRFSLDELPQLWNVLNGSMSLVGPRPALPEEVATYSAREKVRLLVKPGLTCTWQVSGRSEVEFSRWVEMDIDYILNWSPWLDTRLLLATIPAVIAGRGAY